MSKYDVFLIPNDGDGKVLRLMGWDGEEELTLHLSAFARDSVITIEPNIGGEPDD